MTEFLAAAARQLSGSFSASPAPAPRPTLPQLQARLEKVVERSEARAARTLQLYWLRKQLDAAVPDGALKPTQRLEAICVRAELRSVRIVQARYREARLGGPPVDRAAIWRDAMSLHDVILEGWAHKDGGVRLGSWFPKRRYVKLHRDRLEYYEVNDRGEMHQRGAIPLAGASAAAEGRAVKLVAAHPVRPPGMHAPVISASSALMTPRNRAPSDDSKASGDRRWYTWIFDSQEEASRWANALSLAGAYV